MAQSIIGRQLANYAIQYQLGQGGMATVYYAMDTNLDRPVAVKVIDARYQGDPDYARRFVEEAKLIARWRHENIVQVYYAGQEDDIYFYVMEYIEGYSLAELIDDYSATGELMPHDDVLRVGKSLARALDYAHQQEVIHRDVKPQNVMIGFDDRVVLMDFGLALDVQQGTMGAIFGTPHYISPEQARSSADVVPQSDIYSLGVMLYEMFTGVVPFNDPSAATLALQHLSIPPPAPRSINPILPPVFDAVLLKALAKSASERYQSGAELITDLEQAIQQPDDLKNEIESSIPLPPAGMSGQQVYHLSRMSISERIAIKLENKPVPVPVLPIAPPAKSTHPSETVQANPTNTQPARNYTVFVGGATIFIIVILIVGILVFLRRDTTSGDDAGLSATNQSLAQSVTSIPTEVLSIATDNNVVPTAIDIITVTDANLPIITTSAPSSTPLPPSETFTTVPPSSIPTATNANTFMLTATFTEIPPSPIPTRILPTATSTIVPMSLPTVMYPNGRRVELLWNSDSFYILNQAGGSLRVSPVQFEALSRAGTVLPYSFDGGEWSRFFSLLENNKCDAIEVNRATGWLRPAQCRDYNAFTTLSENDQRIFWNGRGDSIQFRVLYNNQEIARCQIEAQTCFVMLPPE